MTSDPSPLARARPLSFVRTALPGLPSDGGVAPPALPAAFDGPSKAAADAEAWAAVSGLSATQSPVMRAPVSAAHTDLASAGSSPARQLTARRSNTRSAPAELAAATNVGDAAQSASPGSAKPRTREGLSSRKAAADVGGARGSQSLQARGRLEIAARRWKALPVVFTNPSVRVGAGT